MSAVPLKEAGKYRKKPVVIEAMQFTTNNEAGSSTMDAIVRWINGDATPVASHDGTYIFIHTLEGVMRADVYDWNIKGVQGEFYPCKPDIFAATYEPADGIEQHGIEPPDGYLLVRDDIMSLTVECKCGVRQAKPVHHYLKQADEETHRRVDEAVRNGRIVDKRAPEVKP